jgi:hypothetical protein
MGEVDRYDRQRNMTDKEYKNKIIGAETFILLTDVTEATIKDLVKITGISEKKLKKVFNGDDIFSHKEWFTLWVQTDLTKAQTIHYAVQKNWPQDIVNEILGGES